MSMQVLHFWRFAAPLLISRGSAQRLQRSSAALNYPIFLSYPVPNVNGGQEPPLFADEGAVLDALQSFTVGSSYSELR